MNDYIDYNNEEVSKYTKTADPRELNVVNRINELKDYKAPIVLDDPVTVAQMQVSHTTIIQVSEESDEVIKEVIEEIKNDHEDDLILFGED